VGLVSVIDAAREGLALLPVGMIGCDGPTLTVRLLSTVPLDRVDRVWVDRESHTSAVLCRVVLERSYGRRPELIEHDALAGDHPETVLLIGDKVVNGSASADRYEHQLDLGQAWRDLTGLPFVYAMWACRPEMVQTPEVRLARAILDRQRRRNQARLEWIVRARAKAHHWPIDLARQYLLELIHYEVGDRQRLAVERFFEEAAAIGVIDPAGPLWADTQPSVTVVKHAEPCATQG
jgi:chorismate dehydratase